MGRARLAQHGHNPVAGDPRLRPVAVACRGEADHRHLPSFVRIDLPFRSCVESSRSIHPLTTENPLRLTQYMPLNDEIRSEE